MAPNQRLLVQNEEYITTCLDQFAFNRVKQLCKRAICIDHGHLRGDGPAEEVCDAYVAAMQRGE